MKIPWKVIGWIALALLCLWVVFTLLRGVGFSFDFLGRKQAQADAYASTDLARDLETEGHAEQAVRTDTYHHSVVTIQSEAATAAAEIRSLPDAETPLDPAFLDGLHAADRRVCETASRICPKADTPASR